MAFGKQRQAKQPREAHAIGMKKLSIQNIVVPIDFSKMSIQAIKTAGRLARRFAASLHLAHVRQFYYAGDFVAPAPPIVPFSFTPYEQYGERSVAREFNALGREYGVSSANCHVLSGAPPFDEICRIAQEIPADLIVMPTHGYTGLKHVFLGSTAERVVQHSPCPVFVVRPRKRKSKTGQTFTAHTILVPVDFSGCSRGGLRYAVDFANEFGARIILLHATYLGYIYSIEGTAIYDIPALQKAARKNAERHMRELVRTVNFGRAKFETAFTDGSPVLDICAFAKGPQCRSDHYIDTWTDGSRTCIDRKRGRTRGPTCALLRSGRAVSSENQNCQPGKTGRSQGTRNRKPPAAKKITAKRAAHEKRSKARNACVPRATKDK